MLRLLLRNLPRCLKILAPNKKPDQDISLSQCAIYFGHYFQSNVFFLVYVCVLYVNMLFVFVFSSITSEEKCCLCQSNDLCYLLHAVLHPSSINDEFIFCVPFCKTTNYLTHLHLSTHTYTCICSSKVSRSSTCHL